MGASSFFVGISLATSILTGMIFHRESPSPEPTNRHVADSRRENSYAASKLTCKTGFKAGVTPVSLKTGGKLACVSIASVNAGKKLLTGATGTCAVCHGAMGITPFSTMPKNLQTQGFTLAPQSILDAYNKNIALMAGEALTLKKAKDLSQYFQTLKVK